MLVFCDRLGKTKQIYCLIYLMYRKVAVPAILCVNLNVLFIRIVNIMELSVCGTRRNDLVHKLDIILCVSSKGEGLNIG